MIASSKGAGVSGAAPEAVKEEAQKADSIPHATASTVEQFQAALRAKYGSARSAFEALNENGFVRKKQWKKAVKRLCKALTPEENKSLRKSLRSQFPKKAELESFVSFVSGVETQKAVDDTYFAKLPDEVPKLPASFRYIGITCMVWIQLYMTYIYILGNVHMPSSSSWKPYCLRRVCTLQPSQLRSYYVLLLPPP